MQKQLLITFLNTLILCLLHGDILSVPIMLFLCISSYLILQILEQKLFEFDETLKEFQYDQD